MQMGRRVHSWVSAHCAKSAVNELEYEIWFVSYKEKLGEFSTITGQLREGENREVVNSKTIRHVVV